MHSTPLDTTEWSKHQPWSEDSEKLNINALHLPPTITRQQTAHRPC